jgi:hypothetical protein
MGEIRGTPAYGVTFPHMVPLPNIFLNRLFSKPRLKRKPALNERSSLPVGLASRLAEVLANNRAGPDERVS